MKRSCVLHPRAQLQELAAQSPDSDLRTSQNNKLFSSLSAPEERLKGAIMTPEHRRRGALTSSCSLQSAASLSRRLTSRAAADSSVCSKDTRSDNTAFSASFKERAWERGGLINSDEPMAHDCTQSLSEDTGQNKGTNMLKLKISLCSSVQFRHMGGSSWPATLKQNSYRLALINRPENIVSFVARMCHSELTAATINICYKALMAASEIIPFCLHLGLYVVNYSI